MSDTTQATSSLSLADINELLASELISVNQYLLSSLSSRIPAMEVIVQHLIASGGKRIRPKLLLLAGQACGCPSNHAELTALAAIVECIHTATLLHDDVVDEADERRGQPTANQRWGNPASVLAGDFLYSRAFQSLLELDRTPITKVLTTTINQLSEGELLQLFTSQETHYSEDTYYQIIESKTAALFRASCQIGALISEPTNTTLHTQLADFGYHLGMAFQITDDLIDYTGDPAITGKPQGSDLAQGKVTLPLIAALNTLSSNERDQMLKTLKSNPADLSDILSFIKSTAAIDHTLTVAKQHGSKAKEAIASLAESDAKEALISLVNFSCQRSF